VHLEAVHHSSFAVQVALLVVVVQALGLVLGEVTEPVREVVGSYSLEVCSSHEVVGHENPSLVDALGL